MTIEEITSSGNKRKHERENRKKCIVRQAGGCLRRLFFRERSKGGLQNAEAIPAELVYVLIEVFYVHVQAISMKCQLCCRSCSRMWINSFKDKSEYSFSQDICHFILILFWLGGRKINRTDGYSSIQESIQLCGWSL